MEENATRKMAPGLGPKNSATGTEKIFRALGGYVLSGHCGGQLCKKMKGAYFRRGTYLRGFTVVVDPVIPVAVKHAFMT